MRWVSSRFLTALPRFCEASISSPDRRAAIVFSDRARAAALAAVPGGTATAVERDEEDGATWEVEVRRPDGISIDVRLDEQFQVVVSEADIEAPDTPPGR